MLLVVFLTSTLVPSSIQGAEAPWWNSTWSFRIEIKIPIDTSKPEAKFQPVDIPIDFNNSCWAKSEKENSVRVIFQDGGTFKELESQIYELNFSDSEHITSCNLIFLVPEEANGNELYFVYYDDEKKSGPNYLDRVEIGESTYQYGPIYGLSFDSSFYKIIQDGFIVYGVNKKGYTMGQTTSQQIAKLKEGSLDIKPSSGEQPISVAFTYWWYKNGKWLYTTSSDKLVSNQVFVNGNLMVKFGIVSQSKDGLLKTTAIYKYYYCPTENKRIYTHVKHEITGYPLPLGDEIDVAFMILPCGGIKSSTIPDLNFGQIPPYLHFYSDEGRVINYDIDQYPESVHFVKMIGKQDDFDLGNYTWLSVDYGETGIAHGAIFESNKILKSGVNERDGMELQLYESNNVQLPGLDGRIAYLYVMRNAYEEGQASDEILPKDYVVEYNAEFFTTESGGYPAVEKESAMYQNLIRFQQNDVDNIENAPQVPDEYSLNAYVHLPVTILFKLWGLKALLKNTYISAELYFQDNLLADGRPSRVSLTNGLKIDFKNISLFRKINFPNLSPGKYLVKIWLKNPPFSNDSKFIGYSLVDLQKNTTVNVYCKTQGTARVSTINQYNSGIENAQIFLIKNDTIVVSNNTDENGQVILGAPCGFKETYTLNILYKGFLVSSQNLKLGRLTEFFPLKKTTNFDVYNLTIEFNDSKKKAPSFDVSLALTSSQMQNPISIIPDSFSNGKYYFYNLYPADYNLSIKYNQFEIQEKIKVPNVNLMSIDLYDFTALLKDNWGLPPEAPLDVSLTSNDFTKVVVTSGEKLSSQEYLFSNLYPGNYTFEANYLNSYLKVPIKIPYNGSNSATLVFPAEFNTTAIIFDSRGNPLKDAKVLIIRGEGNHRKEVQESTSENGSVVFSLPPGVYESQIYSGGELIAKRKIDILADESYSIATTEGPILPLIIIGLALVMIMGAALIGYRKKDLKLFLKILAIGIVIIALFSPWWVLSGSSRSGVQTSTNLYLMPTNMVTITSNENVTAGDVAVLDERFTFVTDLLPVLLSVGFLCLISSIILDKYERKKSSFTVFLLALIIFIGSTVTFFYAMSEFANITVGSFSGSGNLDVAVPGEKIYESLSCSWGASIGFYLLLISVAVLVVIFLLDLRKILSGRKKDS